MVTQDNIDVVYDGGTFGKVLVWCIDRFHKDCKFKDTQNPWHKSKLQGVTDVSRDAFQHNPRFKVRHQFKIKKDQHSVGDFNKNNEMYIPPNNNVIVINYPPEDVFTVRRYALYRTPRMPTSSKTISYIVNDEDARFMKENFGVDGNTENVCVLKEMIKRNYDCIDTNLFYNFMKQFMSNTNYHQFPLDSFYDANKFVDQLRFISEKYHLDLDVEKDVVISVLDHLQKIEVVKTRNRVKEVLQAIDSLDRNFDCSDCDIAEQAEIEIRLQKLYQGIYFPYGTNWFKDTGKIIDFLQTFPKYLLHKGKPLWHN